MSRTRTYIFLVVIVLLISAGTAIGADTLIRTDIRQVTPAATTRLTLFSLMGTHS
jgi:hypothetical protein